MTRTEELPSTTNSPHTRTVLPPRTTEKKVPRPDKSIPNKHWNMPTELSSDRRKLIASPSSHNGEAIKVLIPRKSGNLVLTERAAPESWAVN